VFAAISVQSTYERKRFDKAIEFFCSEALLLKLSEVGTVKIFFGAVGRLQFEVAKSRLENEFGISPLIEFLPYSCSVFVDLAVPLEKITIPAGAKIFLCALGFYVIAFKDFWQERYFKSNNQVRCQSIVLS
ncbi:MAG: hypothetical protein NZO16_06150, partial [Deltaproteobacteria bacterium]|nr:hypothetical protein [Deltaproteobacteria bacterium]